MHPQVASFQPGFEAVMAGAPPSAAEAALLAACQTGELAVAGPDLPPDTSDPARRVRAGLIRFLLLGGDADHRPHPKGVQLAGAWLDGALDLQSCVTQLDLWLAACLLPQRAVLRAARLSGLYLPGCRAAQGLDLHRAHFAGSVHLTYGFHASGEVNLGGASITRQLACGDGRFDGAGRLALNCDGVTVGAGVFLSGGFHASGEVNLRGASITGPLACTDGRFERAGGLALSCDGMTVGASVHLGGGFHAKGEVNLVRARITGQLACDGGRFDGAGGMALNCDAVTVGADVFLRSGFHATGRVDFTRARITGNLRVQQAQLAGGIDLEQARVEAALVWEAVSGVQGQGPWRPNDLARWPLVPGSLPLVDLTEARLGSLRDQAGDWGAVQKLRLGGLVYDRLGPGLTLDQRLEWLALGDRARPSFAPQPYSQLARVLAAEGRRRDAARVRVVREHKLRRAEWQRACQTRHPLGRWLGAAVKFGWDRLYGALFGYGHAPMRALIAVAGLITLTALFFGQVYALGQFAPNSAVILTSHDWLAAVARAETCAAGPPCVQPLHLWAGTPGLLDPMPPARDYESFSRWLYAIDLFLPLDTIGQTEAWAPSRDRGPWGAVAYYARLPIQLAGWLIVALAAAVLTGLVGRQGD